ncbi:flagellar basal body-associated protein FliL [Methylosinus sporium]|nr:flagellar basal body-associated protein FliL [Methylosinus sporium]
MMRMVLIGIWACVVTLASTFGASYWKSHHSAPAEPAAHVEKLEVKKVKPITVPIISDGMLKGYISAEFAYVVEASNTSHGSGGGAVDADSYVMDEAFRRLYADNSLDFRRIEKYDLNSLTRELTKSINQRLGAELVRETLVKSFAFVPKDDIPH